MSQRCTVCRGQRVIALRNGQRFPCRACSTRGAEQDRQTEESWRKVWAPEIAERDRRRSKP